MVKLQTLTITPELASVFLKNNQNNRKLSADKVRQIELDIRNGRWVFNGESIIISDDGITIDGQHRLEACVRSGMPIVSVVVSGVPYESRYSVDQGISRSAGSQAGIQGANHSNIKCGVGRLLIAFETASMSGMSRRGTISNSQILDRLFEDNRLLFLENISGCSRGKGSAKVGNGSMLGFLRYITPDDCERYFIQVRDGEHVGSGDPAFAVRRRLMETVRQQHTEILECYMRGLAAFQKCQKLERVHLTGSLPKVRLYARPPMALAA